MIRITKGPIPEILARNGAAWTKTISDHLAAGTDPTEAEKSRYRHAEIKSALVTETSGKCAYCESKVRHATYGDVEHIVPKSAEPTRAFEWGNLTLACDVCNTNKGTHQGIVDPYEVEPSDHLIFAGASILPRPGSGLGLTTESTLQLNRLPLLERRMEKLRFLNKMLHLLVEVDNPVTVAAIRRDLETNEIGSDKEFAAMAREYIHAELRRIDEARAARPA